MPATIIEHPAQTARQRHSPVARWRWWLVAAAVLIAAGIGYVIFLAFNWPFTQHAVTDALQQASLRTVKIGRFHKTFFPPGCIAEGMQFEHREHKNKPPIISIQSLTLHGSYWALLTAQYRLSLVKVIDMHVTVPPALVHGKPDPIMPLNRTNSTRTLRIDKIIADGAVLDFMHEDGTRPYRITVDKLAVYNVSNNSAISYKTLLTNSVPPGKIRSTGIFGPWDPAIPANTPVRGTYTYQDANLAFFKDFSGIMRAHGAFNGKLGDVHTKGTVDVMNFHVADTSHQRELKASFQAQVNALNGDTRLDDVRAEFDHSSLFVKGTVTGQEGKKGKAISLDLFSENGQIGDILDLFIEARRAPMVGQLQMNAHLDVPPGSGSFLKRLRMSGDFGVNSGRFTNKNTQADLNRLSESAHKKKNEDDSGGEIALSDLKGHGEIRNGVARLTGLNFGVPGATAQMSGTYSIINYDVDLHGKLYTDGKPWTATTGFKSWVLRAITPFLKKKRDMRIVPFKITGNYYKTNVGFDLRPKNQAQSR